MEMSVSSEATFFSTKLQPKICPQLRTESSAEDRGRIDTRSPSGRKPGDSIMGIRCRRCVVIMMTCDDSSDADPKFLMFSRLLIQSGLFRQQQ